MSETKYKRVLLKLSGEILAGDKGYGISADVIGQLVKEIKSILELKVELTIVIGGGNIFRGVQAGAQGLDRTSGDYMGMLATVMNALALQDIMEKNDIDTRVMSAIRMPAVAESYIKRRATRHLEKGRVVIFAGGTGNPFFTTDTAASLRAMEINAEILLKGTKVDAIYDKDPAIHSDATPIKHVSFMEVLQKELKVMDSTAISMCMDNNLPIIVFDILGENNLKNIVQGQDIGTLVTKSV